VTEEQALLATIFATPEDDAPRLIYADWLDEHGQPERAEFIRVQCELAREKPAYIIVVAGNRQQFLDWQRSVLSEHYPHSRGLLRLVIPATREEHLIGLRNCDIVRTGTWGQNPIAHNDRLKICERPGRMRERELLAAADEYIWAGKAVSRCFLTKPFSWRRGFIESGDCRAANWILDADAILATHPVQEVRLVTPIERAMLAGQEWADYVAGERGEAILRRRWPTVKTWHLPTHRPMDRYQTEPVHDFEAVG
jgi:uncharacterized protein (TIGR02996 family)